MWNRRWKMMWWVWLIVCGCVAPLSESVSPTIENFTETDAAGNILRIDPDDWRIQERFRNEVRVRPPFPNPTANGIVSLIVEYNTTAPLGRIDVLSDQHSRKSYLHCALECGNIVWHRILSPQSCAACCQWQFE